MGLTQIQSTPPSVNIIRTPPIKSFHQLHLKILGFPVKIRERIGINVDVCHMWLCKIGPEFLRQPKIRNRIAHVHIGDIGAGHISDLVSGTVHSYDEYCDWFRLFSEIANDLPRPDTLPPFSGCLSVELEAVRDPTMVAAAYYRTRLMLEKYFRESRFFL